MQELHVIWTHAILWNLNFLASIIGLVELLNSNNQWGLRCFGIFCYLKLKCQEHYFKTHIYDTTSLLASRCCILGPKISTQLATMETKGTCCLPYYVLVGLCGQANWRSGVHNFRKRYPNLIIFNWF
jgi:hypothetical protein